MTKPYAPIEFTISDDTVRGTRQPGQPGRPRTAAPEEEPSPRRGAVPKLFEIATDPANLEAYTKPAYRQDPNYLFGVELDATLNNVDEWAVMPATRRSFARAMRSWQRMVLHSGLGDPATDEEWAEIVGARNITKPPGITKSGAEWFVRMYDADLVSEKIRRSGRDPYIQTLVGAIAGGLADPTNVAITAASAAVSAIATVLGAPAVAAAGISLPIVAALRFGPSFVRNLIVKPGVIAATRIITETAAAVPLERDIAEFYGEEYGVGDFAVEAGVALALHGAHTGITSAYKAIRKSLSAPDVVAAHAKANAIVDGTPDADNITPDVVAKHMEPLESFADIPADRGTTPKIKNPFAPEIRARFEEGPDLEALRIERADAFKTEVVRRAELRSAVLARARQAAEDAGLVLTGDDVSFRMKDMLRIALADRAEGLQDRLAPVVTAALKRHIKKVPKGVAVRGTRLVDTVRKHNLTAPQMRQVAEDLIQHLGVSQNDARSMVMILSRDEALSLVDSIMTAARGGRSPDGVVSLRVAASASDKTPPRIKGARVTKNVHKALWLAADRSPRAIQAVTNWLESIGVQFSDRAYFERALVEAGEQYRADFGSGARLDPLDYLDAALNREPVVESRMPPEARAESIAKSYAKGEPVAPSDVVTIKELVGNDDIATPMATSDIRAHVDEIVQTGKIGDMVVDDVNRNALSDLITGIDKLTEALRVCVRK